MMTGASTDAGASGATSTQLTDPVRYPQTAAPAVRTKRAFVLLGLTLATGHHRNGVLLTPVSADVTAAYVRTGVLDEVARPFTLDRFDGATPSRRRLVGHAARDAGGAR